ncbi:transposable element Tcb2 transposase [Trichonephila clavipes]|nr:transposable element Tcb2 transposase [Trichonephila clavipes]
MVRKEARVYKEPSNSEHTQCRPRRNWTAAEWNQIVFSDESRFNWGSDDNYVSVLRPMVKSSIKHTPPTTGVMVWSANACYTWSFLILFHGTVTTQSMFLTFLSHMCCPNGNAHRSHFSTGHCSLTYSKGFTGFPSPHFHPFQVYSITDLSLIKHIWDHLGWQVGRSTSLLKLEA